MDSQYYLAGLGNRLQSQYNKPYYCVQNKSDTCPSCGIFAQNTELCPNCGGFLKDLKQLKNIRMNQGANNQYWNNGCPALMSDGRFISNWRPSTEITNEIGMMNGLSNSNQLRLFMQENGLNLMKEQRAFLIQTNTCAPATACSQGFYDLWMNKNGAWFN